MEERVSAEFLRAWLKDEWEEQTGYGSRSRPQGKDVPKKSARDILLAAPSPFQDFEENRRKVRAQTKWKERLFWAGILALAAAGLFAVLRFSLGSEETDGPVTKYADSRLREACPALFPEANGSKGDHGRFLLLGDLAKESPYELPKMPSQPAPATDDPFTKRLQAQLTCEKLVVQLRETQEVVLEAAKLRRILLSGVFLSLLLLGLALLTVSAFLPWARPFPMLASELVRIDFEQAKESAPAGSLHQGSAEEKKDSEEKAENEGIREKLYAAKPVPQPPSLNANLFAPDLLNSALGDERFKRIWKGVLIRYQLDASGDVSEHFLKLVAKELSLYDDRLEDRYRVAKKLCDALKSRQSIAGAEPESGSEGAKLAEESDDPNGKYGWINEANCENVLEGVRRQLRFTAFQTLMQQLASDDEFHYLLEEKAQGRRRLTRWGPAVLSRFKRPEEKEGKSSSGGLTGSAIWVVLLVGAGSLLTVHFVDDRIEKSSTEIKVDLAGGEGGSKPTEGNWGEKLETIAKELGAIGEILGKKDEANPFQNQVVVNVPRTPDGGVDNGGSCKPPLPPPQLSTGSMVQSCSPVQNVTPGLIPGGSSVQPPEPPTGGGAGRQGGEVTVAFKPCKAARKANSRVQNDQQPSAKTADGICTAPDPVELDYRLDMSEITSEAKTTGGKTPVYQASNVLMQRQFDLKLITADSKKWPEDPIEIDIAEKSAAVRGQAVKAEVPSNLQKMLLWPHLTNYSAVLNADVYVVVDRRRSFLNPASWGTKALLVIRIVPRAVDLASLKP